MKKKIIGVLCYNLTSASTSVLNEISQQASEHLIKAYPIFGPNASENVRYSFRPSYKKPKTIILNNLSGSAPEVQLRTLGLNVIRDLVSEADVICLLGIQGIPALLATLLAYIKKKPILTINQTMSPVAEKNRPFIIRFFKGLVLRLSKYHIAQTPHTIDTLTMNYSIRRENISFIPWDGGAAEFLGVLKKYEGISRKEIRRRFGCPDSTNVLLFCGTLFYLKGVDILIRAFAEIAAIHSDSDLIIVGPDGGESGKLPELKELADSLNIISKVKFLGPQPWDNLAQIYLASDIFILPTRKDVWPKVLVEAGLAGLPLITTEICGGAGYLVKENKNGFIIPVDDVESLVNAIEKLSDSKIRFKFGEESKKIVSRYLNSYTEGNLYNYAISRCLESSEKRLAN